MKIRYLIYLGLVLLMPQLILANAIQELPSEIVLKVGEIVDLTEKKYRWETTKELKGYEVKCEKAVDELAGLLKPEIVDKMRPLEGENMTAKWIVIAWERKNNPKWFRRIASRMDLSLKEEKAVSLDEIKAEPEVIRLAWEYNLLRPIQNYIWRRQQEGYENLVRIRNENSLLATEEMYRLTTIKEINPESVGTDQVWIMDVFCNWKTEEALRSYLKCLLITKGRIEERSKKQKVITNIYKSAIEDLPYFQWKTLLPTLDLNTFSPVERAILEPAIQKIREGENKVETEPVKKAK